MMKDLTIAKVAVENTAYSFDMLFDYSVPDYLCSEISVGKRVLVPFGNSSKKRVGIVFLVNTVKNIEKRLKKIDSILDDEPLLTFEMLKTANFVRERCFCTYFEACKMFLPLGFSMSVSILYAVNGDFTGEITDENEKTIFDYLKDKNHYIKSDTISKACSLTKIDEILDSMVSKGILLRNVDAQRRTGDATVKMVRLKADINDNLSDFGKITAKQKEVIKVLTDVGMASIKEICYFTGYTSAVVSALESKGIVEIFDSEIYRSPYSDIDEPEFKEIILSEEQNKAFEGLLSLYNDKVAKGALLYGVTGSGKTQVYLKLIDEALKSDKGIIVMIPEISLTPQLLSVFYERYGSKVAVLHSALSLGQRLDEWKRIKRGEVQIVVGTRSAVFAPFDKIGLIIIDEEQEHTYKSEMTPRYHTREVASYRIGCHNGLLLLTSATPSIDTYTKAMCGSYSLFKLENRYGNAVLPTVETIDITYQSDMVLENVSKKLADEIKSTVDNGKQCILLLNRRGYNTYVSCTECGTVATCPNCSISMTYHIKNGRLMCHYCGYSIPYTKKCNNCNNDTLKFVGAGTQKLEEELNLIVPDAKILRMDTDTTNSRYSYEENFNSFGKGEYDILVGTQMVAKGLNFENVTLVGVLSVDQMLYNDDYKSGERVFDLITQVVGRSGRGKSPGKAYIQTAFSDSEIICLAKEQDYDSFYDIEINMRKQMVYPPFCDICVIGFSSEKDYSVTTSSHEFLTALKSLHIEKYSDLNIIVLGPVSPRISKVGGKFRSRIIIKCRNDKKFREMISELLKDFDKNKNNVNIYVDINPESLM
ncbi:MAG: primosomal protein N' [Clostridia bacterium]|nr:primosomal protein N' [Clostridia bacterium]